MISDDQSFPHASAYGSKMVSTPNFDRIASEGMLFTNAVCAAPVIGRPMGEPITRLGKATADMVTMPGLSSDFSRKGRTALRLFSGSALPIRIAATRKVVVLLLERR